MALEAQREQAGPEENPQSWPWEQHEAVSVTAPQQWPGPCRGAHVEDVLSTAKGGGQRTGAHSAEGKVAGGRGAMWVGECLLIKCKLRQTACKLTCLIFVSAVWAVFGAELAT